MQIDITRSVSNAPRDATGLAAAGEEPAFMLKTAYQVSCELDPEAINVMS